MKIIMRFIKKIDHILGIVSIKLASIIRPSLATKVAIFFYGRWGMIFIGKPNYLSSRINFDGTNYSLIEIHSGVTISSYVRILTHDWSLYTVAKSVNYFSDKPIGEIRGINIGEYSFVGTGTIIMPGTKIGRGCIIGAGTVVRGNIPDYSIVVGSPGLVIGDTRRLIASKFKRQGIDVPQSLAELLSHSSDASLGEDA